MIKSSENSSVDTKEFIVLKSIAISRLDKLMNQREDMIHKKKTLLFINFNPI